MGGGSGAQEVVMSRATKRTIAAVRTTEQLMEAIDLAMNAWRGQQEYKEALATWTALQNESKSDENQSSLKLQMLPRPTPPLSRVELNGLSPHRFLFNALTTLTMPLMNEVVVALPFSYAEKVSA